MDRDFFTFLARSQYPRPSRTRPRGYRPEGEEHSHVVCQQTSVHIGQLSMKGVLETGRSFAEIFEVPAAPPGPDTISYNG